MILRMDPAAYEAHQRRVKDARPVRPLDSDAEILEELEPVAPKRPPKYGNEAKTVDGIWFRSKAEAQYYIGLKWREKAGQVTNVKRQVRYKLAIEGRLICEYVSDFEFDEDGKHHVVDVKGWKAGGAYRLFQIKAALMKIIHGIEVEEA